jgi:DNA-binding PadR family transcriptional regulator
LKKQKHRNSEAKEGKKTMLFDKIFRGYRIVSQSTWKELDSQSIEEINLGLYTDYISPKSGYRNVDDSITIRWAADGTPTIEIPDGGVSENSMQIRGFADWYERVKTPTIDQVITRLNSYGFVDITSEERNKQLYYEVLENLNDELRSTISSNEVSVLKELEKYKDGELKLSQLHKFIHENQASFDMLLNKIKS